MTNEHLHCQMVSCQPTLGSHSDLFFGQSYFFPYQRMLKLCNPAVGGKNLFLLLKIVSCLNPAPVPGVMDTGLKFVNTML